MKKASSGRLDHAGKPISWWGRRFRLRACTGPRPALCRLRQAGRDGVALDVSRDPLDLPGIARVVIEGLILPERLTSSSQDLVSTPRGRSLQPTHQHRNGNFGKDEQMNMVRHDHPGAELIEASFALSNQNGLSHQIRGWPVPEPEWTRGYRSRARSRSTKARAVDALCVESKWAGSVPQRRQVRNRWAPGG
jgi:hypothetical protein